MSLSIPLILIVGILSYFVIPFILLCCCKGRLTSTIIWILFAVYIVVLLCGVLSKYNIVDRDYILYFDFGYYSNKAINWRFWKVGIVDVLINIIMLIPIGQVIAHFVKTKSKTKVLIVLLVSGLLSGIVIETLQYILPINRSVQLSDVIFNIISVVLGGLNIWLYEWIIKKLFKSKR